MRLVASPILCIVFACQSAFAQDASSTVDALVQFAYQQLDLGRQFNRSGLTKERCIDEVEKAIVVREKDPAFLAPLEGHKFDKQVYLFLVIGGSAFAQCIEPRELTVEQYRKQIEQNVQLTTMRPR